jgi:uncharacterized protein
LPEDLRGDNADLISELSRCYAWIEGHLPSRSLYECHRLGDINLKVPRIRNCGIGENGMTLTSDGKCCLCQYEMANPLGDACCADTVGLITNQTRYSLSKHRVDRLPVCSSCKWRFACGGGCPYLTKSHYGTFEHPSPYCEVYQSAIPKLVRIHAIQLIRRSNERKEVIENAGTIAGTGH